MIHGLVNVRSGCGMLVLSLLLPAILCTVAPASPPGHAHGHFGHGGFAGGGAPFYHHHHGGLGLGIGAVSPGFFRGYSSASLFLGGGYPYGYGAFGYGTYNPYFYGYGPYYYGYSPYGISYSPGYNYLNYYLPPVSMPAELNFGPQAVKQFMGVDRNFGLGALAPGAVGAAKPDVPPKVPTFPETVRTSNAATRERAMRYVDIGDELFDQQKYHEANERYKTAQSQAPDVAEIYFRQGHALSAMGRYAQAADAFRRGLLIQPDWVQSKFRLDQLYGDDRLAKTSQLEAMAQTALDNPHDADALLAIGMFLHFDGQPERARKFFQRSAELSAPNDGPLRPLLSPAAAPPGDRVAERSVST